VTDPDPRWNEVRPTTAPDPNKGGPPAIVGPLVLLLVSLVIWRLGRVRTAQVTAAAALVLGVILVASPPVRSFVARVSGAVTRGVSKVLAIVLLVPTYYLVVVPLGLLIRAFGGRPLDVSLDPGRSSYWTLRTAGADTRPKRMFADQRGWRPVGFSPSQRRRVVLRTVVATTLIEAVLVAGIVYVRDATRTPRKELTGVSAGFTNRSAAVAGYDWAADAYAEQARVTNGMVYTPFTGVSLRDFSGQYFNVKHRVRKSYESPLAATQEPLDVWFFGGSTMFGFDLLRDDHTIPSEIVRLAESAGIPVRARNYGMAGFVNYQETVLLSLVVTAEEPPDLVVFYDGINDSSMSLLNTFGALNPPGEPGDLGALLQRRALVTGVLPGSSSEAPSPLGQQTQPRPPTAARVAANTASVYRQGFDLSRALGDRYGFEVMHFWQPDYYTKTPLDENERALMKPLGLDQRRLDAMTALWARIRAALPPEVIDISDALDGMEGPILVDSIHTNERGSLAVSQAMFEHVRPVLSRLK